MTKVLKSHIFIKIGKLILWVLIPTLFISGTKLSNEHPLIFDNNKDYTLQTSGNLNTSLSGAIDFETSVVTTSKGITFSILKLKLDNKQSVLPHSMEFLISEENVELLSEGTYEVSRNEEGLLNYFDGVFGFANIDALGELPFFAKNGKIQISYLDKTTVKGVMRIEMKNAIGKSVNIEGNFNASK